MNLPGALFFFFFALRQNSPIAECQKVIKLLHKFIFNKKCKQSPSLSKPVCDMQLVSKHSWGCGKSLRVPVCHDDNDLVLNIRNSSGDLSIFQRKSKHYGARPTTGSGYFISVWAVCDPASAAGAQAHFGQVGGLTRRAVGVPQTSQLWEIGNAICTAHAVSH